MTTDFDLFKLSDEHNELRAVLRDLCETQIAPYASSRNSWTGWRCSRCAW